MSAFIDALRSRQPRRSSARRWIYAPYDQLSGDLGPLAAERPEDLGVVLVESSWKAARRRYHKQKLALVLANMRHFAIEQAERGVAVRYVTTDEPYETALAACARELGPIDVMEPAERELRQALAPLAESGVLRLVPHEGWLSTPDDFTRSQAGKSTWRMDRFYRHMRARTGLLMVDGKPEGGKLSFDADNRKPWPGTPDAPTPPTFRPDDITREVCGLVDDAFADHPGAVSPSDLPATRADADRLWSWAKQHCMPYFGPFEDAMSTRSSGLFHTRIAPLLNLHRLLPRDVVDDVAGLDVPLACREGFIRQVLGWREFVRHVHRETDGLRALPDGFRANHLDSERPLPAAYWGTPCGLNCLDTVVAEVWRDAYSHHITRLMILCNLAALLDCDPREVADWFWVAYADAYDWVVEPNVLGMGLFAVGDLMTTKPYVSGAPYINKMSDYCEACRFHPKRTCPITPLYWAFLARHEHTLAKLPRMRVPLASLRKRSPDKREADRRTFEAVSASLANGDELVVS